MSENDNLPEADGKNEVEINETTPKPTEETTIENTPIEEPPVTEPEAATDTTETSVKNESENPSEEVETTENVTEETTAEEAHVSDIEDSNAEDAEDEANAERHKLEDKDYHAMSMDQLVSEFENLLKKHKIQTISKHINEIKSEFNSKYSALLDEKKEEFIADGGNQIDFYYSNDTKKRFNSAYKEYKQSINAYYKEREQNLKQNLENRLADY